MLYNKKFSYSDVGKNFNREDYLLVTYKVKVSGAFQKTIEGIAAESSIGSWTDLKEITQEVYDRFAAKIASIKKSSDNEGVVKIAYPLELFEQDNLAQLLSIINGNFYGFAHLEALSVEDIIFPEKYVKASRGAVFGTNGLRDKVKVYNRPILSAVVKPKIGISVDTFAKLAYQAWVGGVDIVRDDENLTDQDINPFYERISLVHEARREAEKVTGEKKLYMPNVTSRISKMYARAKYLQELGGESMMMDVLDVGISGVQFMREQNIDLLMYGHRLFTVDRHASIGRVSKLVVAKLSRLAGLDLLQVPTVLERGEDFEEAKKVWEFVKTSWHGLAKIMPVSSGGIHPGSVEQIIKIFGENQVINMGGGIFGHPEGAEPGARAFRQVVNGVVEGMSTREISRKSVELKRALDKWGVYGEEEYEHRNEATNVHALAKRPKSGLVLADSLELKAEDNEVKSVSVREEG